MSEKSDLEKMGERQDGDYKAPILKEPEGQKEKVESPGKQGQVELP